MDQDAECRKARTQEAKGKAVNPLETIARMLGVAPRHAEDALHSERAARAVLTRRNLFAAGAALASGAVFSIPVALPRTTFQRFSLFLNGNKIGEASMLICGDYGGSYDIDATPKLKLKPVEFSVTLADGSAFFPRQASGKQC
jgi:hypothetical protein